MASVTPRRKREDRTGVMRASEISRLIESEQGIYDGWKERIDRDRPFTHKDEDALKMLLASAARMNQLLRIEDGYFPCKEA